MKPYPLSGNQPVVKRKRPRIYPLSIKQLTSFWGRVDKKKCWHWTGGHNSSGRSIVKLHGIQLLAPRVSYAMHAGFDPGNWDVLHTCDNPSCVNPEHLFLGTPEDNAADMIEKGRFVASCGNTKVDLDDPKSVEILKSDITRIEKSELLHVSLKQISALCKRLGLPDGRRKLSESDIESIVSDENTPFGMLAEKFGVNYDRIGEIRRANNCPPRRPRKRLTC